MSILHLMPLNDKVLRSGWWGTGDCSLQSFREVLSPTLSSFLTGVHCSVLSWRPIGDPLLISGAPSLCSSAFWCSTPHSSRFPPTSSKLSSLWLLPSWLAARRLSPAGEQKQPGALNAFFSHLMGITHCLSLPDVQCLSDLLSGFTFFFSGKKVKMVPFISSWLEMEV